MKPSLAFVAHRGLLLKTEHEANFRGLMIAYKINRKMHMGAICLRWHELERKTHQYELKLE